MTPTDIPRTEPPSTEPAAGIARRHLLALAAASVFLPGMAVAAPLPAGEKTSFVFKPPGYFADKPLTVHTYKAHSAGADAQVLIAVHGMERAAAGARNNWVPFAEKNKLIVLAPEFDAARYPARVFNMGNLAQPDRARWSLQIVEQLFDFIRAQENLTRPDYILFGHSAGAQYVHRLMLLTPSPRVSLAISANAGSYTLPRYAGPNDNAFPYALDEKTVPPAQLRQVFARKLLVLLGEADTETDAANLPKAPEAKAQGANRLERGKRFFAAAQEQAQALGAPFAWQLKTVPGVGHNARGMSAAAGRLLFGAA